MLAWKLAVIVSLVGRKVCIVVQSTPRPLPISVVCVVSVAENLHMTVANCIIFMHYVIGSTMTYFHMLHVALIL